MPPRLSSNNFSNAGLVNAEHDSDFTLGKLRRMVKLFDFFNILAGEFLQHASTRHHNLNLIAFNVLPIHAVNYVPNLPAAHSEPFSQLRLRNTLHSIEPSYLNNLTLGKLRQSASFSKGVSVLLNFIKDIACVVSKKKMIGPNARRIIAMVTDAHTGRYWAVGHQPSNLMGTSFISGHAAPSYPSIPTRIPTSHLKYPAPVRFSNLLPKPFYNAWIKMMSAKEGVCKLLSLERLCEKFHTRIKMFLVRQASGCFSIAEALLHCDPFRKGSKP